MKLIHPTTFQEQFFEESGRKKPWTSITYKNWRKVDNNFLQPDIENKYKAWNQLEDDYWEVVEMTQAQKDYVDAKKLYNQKKQEFNNKRYCILGTYSYITNIVSLSSLLEVAKLKSNVLTDLDPISDLGYIYLDNILTEHRAIIEADAQFITEDSYYNSPTTGNFITILDVETLNPDNI